MHGRDGGESILLTILRYIFGPVGDSTGTRRHLNVEEGAEVINSLQISSALSL